MRFWKSWK